MFLLKSTYLLFSLGNKKHWYSQKNEHNCVWFVAADQWSGISWYNNPCIFNSKNQTSEEQSDQ